MAKRKTYTVRSGDDIVSIAAENGTSPEQLAAANPHINTWRPGIVVAIPEDAGTITKAGGVLPVLGDPLNRPTMEATWVRPGGRHNPANSTVTSMGMTDDVRAEMEKYAAQDGRPGDPNVKILGKWDGTIPAGATPTELTNYNYTRREMEMLNRMDAAIAARDRYTNTIATAPQSPASGQAASNWRDPRNLFGSNNLVLRNNSYGNWRSPQNLFANARLQFKGYDLKSMQKGYKKAPRQQANNVYNPGLMGGVGGGYQTPGGGGMTTMLPDTQMGAGAVSGYTSGAPMNPVPTMLPDTYINSLPRTADQIRAQLEAGVYPATISGADQWSLGLGDDILTAAGYVKQGYGGWIRQDAAGAPSQPTTRRRGRNVGGLREQVRRIGDGQSVGRQPSGVIPTTTRPGASGGGGGSNWGSSSNAGRILEGAVLGLMSWRI